ncbi:MAG: site-specific DNA-methyltransferase [Alphaproteobacteria bacterium]|nr:site-specific DNA-methyltransferase [Alphaproteobacteria bacterium]
MDIKELENKIINADCLDILKQLPDKCVDLVLTDPPYGMDYQSGWREQKYEKIQDDNNLDWLPSFLEELKRVSKDDSIWYVFCSWHNVDKFKQEIEKVKNVKNILIWNKNNFGSGDLFCDYAPKYEMCIFCNENKKLNGNRIANVLNFAKTKNELHPTQKPVDLFGVLIQKGSQENDLVLDCFSGSGTTAIACHNLKRRFICIEKDKDYYEASVKRLADAQKQMTLF